MALAKLYWHLPGAEEVKYKGSFHTFEDARNVITKLIPDVNQYVAVIEYDGNVGRYLVTKGAGLLEVIPMHTEGEWTEKDQMVSEVINFVMANHEMPLVPGEDE